MMIPGRLLLAAWMLAASLSLATMVSISSSAGGAEPTPEEIGEVQTYATVDQALREVYDHVARVDVIRAALTPDEAARLQESLGFVVGADTVVVFAPRAGDGALLGYAVIENEVGKYRPITFLVGVGPDLRVRGVEVLVYRESRGGEIRRTRFLRQYRGKHAGDPIRTNRDILNVAGATLSVTAMNKGVKRALGTLAILAGNGILEPAP
jgi:hypothetical protein